MKSFFDKIKVRKAAVDSRYRKNLSVDAYTTQDFFIMKPIYCRELVPNADFSMNIGNFTRTMPLTRPLYGDVRVVTRSFAVPLRTLMNGFNEFITDTPYRRSNSASTIPSSTPYFTNTVLRQVFGLAANSSFETVRPNKAYDFILTSTDSNRYGYTLTKKGRILYDIFLGLGYQINFVNNVDESTIGDTSRMSALPFLAYCKIVNDYYTNPNYNQEFFYKFDADVALSVNDIQSMVEKILFTNYEKDFFTTAWLSPTNTSYGSSFSFQDPTISQGGNSPIISKVGTTHTAAPDTPAVTSVVGNADSGVVQNLTQTALNFLKRATDYVTRNHLAGLRPLDRFLARYGVKLESAKLDRCIYLGSATNQVQISDVTASTDFESSTGETQALGSLAGKALGYGKGSISYHTDEQCYIISITSVVPHIGYYQGRSPHVFHTQRLDFYTPEYDGISVAPLRRDHLFGNIVDYENEAPSGTPLKMTDVIGWSSQYNYYKCAALDIVSGSFRLNSRNAGLDKWHLMRIVPYSQSNISTAFVRADNEQYDRVFNNSNGEDHFVSVFHFEVSVTDSVKPLFDDFDFDGGHEVNMEINGTQLY